MKFEDLKFHGKDKVRRVAVNEIYDILNHIANLRGLSQTRIVRYIEILVDGQDYDPSAGVFYEEVTNRKLTYGFLAVIAKEYILEHVDEFKYSVGKGRGL